MIERVNRLMFFQRYQYRVGFGLIGLFLFLNATVLATSHLMEGKRGTGDLPFQWWEPFVWEYTSSIAVLMLVPCLHWLMEKLPLSFLNIRRTFLLYSSAACLFSVAHVSLMVGMRKAIYFSQDLQYVFGDLSYEFLYELRKDLLTFVIFVIVALAYRFITSRIIGEANLVAEGESNDSDTAEVSTRLLVKKLGKEFIVNLHEVEWAEASGNYVNLHIKERIYPIRKTLSAFANEVSEKGFCRIHRSHMINLGMVESITPIPSGDAEVQLKSGKTLNLSRRYKDALKERLSLCP
ncbi:MAG: LytTR family transcriptional regulator [Agarilytica sp.]